MNNSTGTTANRSGFVTGLAWTLIALGGFATLIALLQNIMLTLMFPMDEMRSAMHEADKAHPMPPLFRFMFDNFRLFFASFLAGRKRAYPGFGNRSAKASELGQVDIHRHHGLWNTLEPSRSCHAVCHVELASSYARTGASGFPNSIRSHVEDHDCVYSRHRADVRRAFWLAHHAIGFSGHKNGIPCALTAGLRATLLARRCAPTPARHNRDVGCKWSKRCFGMLYQSRCF